MKHQQSYILLTAITLALLAACGGGSDTQATINDPATAATPAGGTTTLVTTTCTPAPELQSPYSRVFKGCDSAGVAQYYELTECVRDNATGLIWQGHTPAGTGLRGNDQYITNLDSTAALQKWNGGVSYIAPTQADIDAITNSIGFKNAVNASNLCGFSNWRLPTKDELLGIVKTSESPTIDNTWFPNTPGGALGFYYWTSSPSMKVEFNAWVVSFGNGLTYETGRDYNGPYGYGGHRLRLVRQ